MTTEERLEKLEKELTKLRANLFEVAEQWTRLFKRPPVVPIHDGTKTLGLSDSWTFTRPVAYLFLGQQHEVRILKNILLGVCRTLHDKHKADFAKVLSLRGFSQDARNSPSTADAREIASSGIYVRANLSASDLRERCREVLHLFGYSESELKVTVRNRQTR